MPQATSTVLLRGGLNLVTPPAAVPPGMAIAALNYEPEVAGCKRIGGYERFDGQASPSSGADAAEIAALRALIAKVPGTGPVRGVHVYDSAVWAFRDTVGVGGAGAMYKSTPSGWELQPLDSYVVNFTAGTAEFLEAEVLTGGTSGATATIERVVLRDGSFTNGDATGFLVVSGLTGTFEAETGTSASGSATVSVESEVAIAAGGRYDFVNHNFYGSAGVTRMHFANGVGTAFEWDGEVLAPIVTGTDAGLLADVVEVWAVNNDVILSVDDDNIVMPGDYDKPTHIEQFKNHLWLAFRSGAIINSGIGEPLDYRAIAGAAEISFGDAITGFTPAATALVVFGSNRIEYIAGSDSTDFIKLLVTDNAGGVDKTVQMMDAPLYLDDAGVRKLSSSAAFGDFRMGTLTQAIQPLFKRKRDAGVAAVASFISRGKDQYWLFFDDGSGIIIYLGRKEPETLPFLLPVTVSCATSGELNAAEGERLFVGGEDGFVYELEKGTSFDGAEVQAYLRLAWNTVGAPSQEKRWHKVSFDIDAPSEMEIGVAFHVDYAIPGNPGGARQDIDVAQGSESLIDIGADYDAIDWTQPTQGVLEAYLSGIGRNCAVTLVTEHTAEEPHTISTMTMNFSPRRVLR